MIYTDVLLYTVYILYYHYDCYIFYYIIIIMMCDPINILSLSLSFKRLQIQMSRPGRHGRLRPLVRLADKNNIDT